MPKSTYQPQYLTSARDSLSSLLTPSPRRRPRRVGATAPLQARISRHYLLAIAICLMVLLTACGGEKSGGLLGNTSNTSPTSTPPAAANTPDTPPASTGTATPTPRPTPAPGFTQTVLIITDSNGSFSFSPATLTIRVGTTVIWKNMSSAPHTITSDDGQTFDSGTISPGGTFQFKFTTAGTFPYHCNYHPYMRATISPQ